MKQFKKIMALLIVAMLIAGLTTALADKVKLTGTANLRSGAGLGYSIKTSIPKGKTATYLNESKKDDRGVRWYYVKYNGKSGWVSSKYAKLQ